MLLSQCMIVKNEEKNIRRALSWGKGIVSEQIVVDTGSTDRTVEIAKEMGAKVYHFEWISDFAAAKNYAIGKASGEWIAFLDADEYLTEKDAKKIPEILKGLDSVKFKKTGESVNVFACVLADLNIDGKVKDVIRQTRFFRNRPYIRYVGRIHEQIMALGKHHLICAEAGDEVTIYHTGYAWTKESLAVKSERNLGMLLNELELNPRSAKTKMYLAQTYNLAEKYEDMLKYAREASDNEDGSLDHDQALLNWQYYMYAIFRTKSYVPMSEEEVLKVYEKAVACSKVHPDYDMALGFWYYADKQPDKCKKYLLMAFDKAEDEAALKFSRMPSHLQTIYNMLVEVSLKLDEWPDVVKYATLSFKMNKKNDGFLSMLLARFVYVDKEALENVIAYLKRIYDFSDRRDLYYLLKVVGKANFKEVEGALKEYLTLEERMQIYKE